MDVHAAGERAKIGSVPDFDVIIVGAGFSGIYLLYRLRQMKLSVLVVEAGKDVGGTWYWNRYPGARCDIESLDYSYSFSEELQQEWSWSERFASQSEILSYLQHVVERFDLRHDMRFDTRVVSADFDGVNALWTLETERGQQIGARFYIMATGCLSAPRLPHFAGLKTFRGACYATGSWPHEGVDFSGQRVGVIGTGSSAIQSIPVIAKQASSLVVFQRTPAFSLPGRNAAMDPEYERAVKEVYLERRQKARLSANGLSIPMSETSALEVSDVEREQIYRAQWEQGGLIFGSAFHDVMTDHLANKTAADFLRTRIRERIIDPATAELLVPKNYPMGAKRLCVDNGYYETFNEDHVTLVDISASPIECFTADGIRTQDADYALDAVVFATGFDAMTGALLAVDIHGAEHRSLREKWAAGPLTYLGLMTAGFPNLFMVTGPGSPSVLTNMVVSIEQHAEWISNCINDMQRRGARTIDADPQAEREWVNRVNEESETTVFPVANSWYLGANIEGKPRVFMPYVGGVGVYREICDEVVAKDYEGFILKSA